MAWPSGRMRSLPVSPRNSSARGKGFSFVCSSPLKSTQGEGGDKKTCRSCNVMYPRITINPYRAKEAAAGRLIPLREARHGTARPAPTPFSGGAALTHMFGDLSSRVTRADDPRPRARPAAPLPAPRPAAPRSPATPRETEVGKGRTQLMALHGQPGGARGCEGRPATRRAGGCRAATAGRGPRLPEHPLAPSPPTPYPRCGIRCSPSLRGGSGERRQPQQRVGGEGRERRRSERSRSLQRETPGWPSGDRRGVMVR